MEDVGNRSPLEGWKLLILRRVLRSRCPQCGQGALRASAFRLARECAGCGLVYRRESGSATGSMYLSAAVTEVFAALLILVGYVFTNWSTAVFLSVALPVAAGFSLFFLPRSQALWVAIEYMTDVLNREAWARPRR